MNIKTQIISIIFSFIYGIAINLVYKKIYKYLFKIRKIYCLLNSLLFLIDLTLIYFKIFYLINNGIINIYFVFITLLTSISFSYKNFTKNM